MDAIVTTSQPRTPCGAFALFIRQAIARDRERMAALTTGVEATVARCYHLFNRINRLAAGQEPERDNVVPLPSDEPQPDHARQRGACTRLQQAANRARAAGKGTDAARLAWRDYYALREMYASRGMIPEAPRLTAEQEKSCAAKGMFQFNSLRRAREWARRQCIWQIGQVRPAFKYITVAKHPRRGDYWCFRDSQPQDADTIIERHDVSPRASRGKDKPGVKAGCVTGPSTVYAGKVTPAPYRRGDMIRRTFTVSMLRGGELVEERVRAIDQAQAESIALDRFPGQLVEAAEVAVDWEVDDFPGTGSITVSLDDAEPCDDAADFLSGDEEAVWDIPTLQIQNGPDGWDAQPIPPDEWEKEMPHWADAPPAWQERPESDEFAIALAPALLAAAQRAHGEPSPKHKHQIGAAMRAIRGLEPIAHPTDAALAADAKRAQRNAKRRAAYAAKKAAAK